MGRQENTGDAQELRALLKQAGHELGETGPDADGGQACAEALYMLTRMRFEPEEARCYWLEIVRHHTGLNQVLGRDVGLRVAVCDYFMNLHPKMREPVIVEVQVLLQKEKGALIDELTGLYNRRYFNDAIAREVERFKRFGQRFSLIMLDVDHFKHFNDSYGHQAGDLALRTVATLLRETARTFDHVVRYGGEEFTLILPHTDGEQALAAAERMRRAVASNNVPVEGQMCGVPLTVSLGVATFPEDAINGRDLVNRADEALYEAKRTRNTVSGFSEKNRRFARAPLNLMVICRDAAGTSAHVSAINVSFGGMLCISPTPVLPGERVEVSLESDARGRRGLSVSGRVVRLERESEASDYEIALSFELSGQEERRALVRLVELNQATAL